MKKFLSIAIVALMILSSLALASCGGSSSADLSESKYVGTWKALGMSLGDDSEALDEELTLTLNGDGTGQLASAEEVSEFTWSEIDGGFKTKGDVKLTFKDDGDNIKATILGVDLNFEKQ